MKIIISLEERDASKLKKKSTGHVALMGATYLASAPLTFSPAPIVYEHNVYMKGEYPHESNSPRVICYFSLILFFISSCSSTYLMGLTSKTQLVKGQKVFLQLAQ